MSEREEIVNLGKIVGSLIGRLDPGSDDPGLASIRLTVEMSLEDVREPVHVDLLGRIVGVCTRIEDEQGRVAGSWADLAGVLAELRDMVHRYGAEIDATWDLARINAPEGRERPD